MGESTATVLRNNRRVAPGSPPAPKTRTLLEKRLGSQVHIRDVETRWFWLPGASFVVSLRALLQAHYLGTCFQGSPVRIVDRVVEDKVDRESADMTAT